MQSKPLKVLIGITKSKFGGAQRYVLEMAIAAKEAGHDVAVLCGTEGALVGKLEEAGIRIIPLPSMERNVVLKKEYKNFFSIYHILKKERPDVFHLNSSKMGGLGSLAARITHVPKIIFTAHGFEFNAPRPDYQKVIFKFLYWLTFLFSHEVICVSERLVRDISDWLFVSPKITLIRNGVEDFERLPRAAARKILAPNASEETLIVGTLSELHKVKGLDLALKAFKDSLSERDARFVIVGDGDERESLISLAESLGIEDKVNFLGFYKDARELLSGFDIFTLTSRSEGMPYALLEAGLAKLPVVATHVGGIPEVVEDGISGFLAPPENPYFIAKALRELADNKDKRESFGATLRITIQNKFDKQDMIALTLALYRVSQHEVPESSVESSPISPETATQ